MGSVYYIVVVHVIGGKDRIVMGNMYSNMHNDKNYSVLHLLFLFNNSSKHISEMDIYIVYLWYYCCAYFNSKNWNVCIIFWQNVTTLWVIHVVEQVVEHI